MSRILDFSTFSRVFFLLIGIGITFTGCSSTGAAGRAAAEHAVPEVGVRVQAPPAGRILLEPLEGAVDTVTFHIGSPLLLRLRMGDRSACDSGTGQFFYFDPLGTQLGWGFQEVADSVLLAPLSGSYCERFLLLSSEASNRLAEGTFAMNVSLYLDADRKIPSNTIILHPVRSTTGADQESYARFLQEQLLIRPDQLRDPETLDALFGDGVPISAESEVYRGVVLYRAGDLAGAEAALRSAVQIEKERRTAMTAAATRTRELLQRALGRSASKE